MPVIVSTHPRTKNMIDTKGLNLIVSKNLETVRFNDYVKLQIKSKQSLVIVALLVRNPQFLVLRL